MDFELTEEQKMVKKTSKEIAADFEPEYWREKEEEGEFASAFWDTLGEVGFTGLPLPEEYGGGGMGILETIIAMEELCANNCGIAGMWYLCVTTVFGGLPIAKYGTEEQKEKYLPGIASGDTEWCMGLTEPNAGTNSLNINTFAEKDGDEYVINGEKIFISGAVRADGITLVTRTSKLEDVDKRTDGLTLFATEFDEDAIEVQKIPKHGINYTNTCELYIDDLRVHEDDILGEKGQGWWHLVNDILNPERMSFGAGAEGIGRLAINSAVDYAKDREVFGIPIGSHQGISFPLAKSYSKIKTASLLNKKAAWKHDRGENCGPECNTAKCVAVNAGIEAVYNAMQTFGGYGYAKEYDVERWWREVNLIRLAPVTQQMAYNYVAHHVLGLPRSY